MPGAEPRVSLVSSRVALGLYRFPAADKIRRLSAGSMCRAEAEDACRRERATARMLGCFPGQPSNFELNGRQGRRHGVDCC